MYLPALEPSGQNTGPGFGIHAFCFFTAPFAATSPAGGVSFLVSTATRSRAQVAGTSARFASPTRNTLSVARPSPNATRQYGSSAGSALIEAVSLTTASIRPSTASVLAFAWARAVATFLSAAFVFAAARSASSSRRWVHSVFVIGAPSQTRRSPAAPGTAAGAYGRVSEYARRSGGAAGV